MNYLVDTNILLRLNQDTHPMHTVAASAVKKLLDADEEIFIIP
jgi:predicted nucleic acid-binding protein